MSASVAQNSIASNSKALSISARWIISRRDDLVWFIGAALLCYAVFALTTTTIVPLYPVLLACSMIDLSHIVSTYSRTYLDRAERRARKRLFFYCSIFFLIGPVMVLLGGSVIFFLVVAVWVFYHQIKQHYGFAVLYKIKNNDVEPIDNKLDRLFLMLAIVYPVTAFVVRDSQMMARLPGAVKASASYLMTALLVITIAVTAVWVARQVQRARLGHALNLPKYLLFAATIPLYWLVSLAPASHKLSTVILILSPLHALQYHRLIWFHNKKYTSGEDCKERYGAASLISRRLLYYIAYCVFVALSLYGMRYLSSMARGSAELFSRVAIAFLLGPVLIHVYLDTVIWRVRRDRAVGEALHLEHAEAKVV
jgi:hypothetical protein